MYCRFAAAKLAFDGSIGVRLCTDNSTIITDNPRMRLKKRCGRHKSHDSTHRILL